ncbi:hypothetical protein R1flu_001205 [Riccia fluitans]|uniref:Uncharacterized protein n=1 Tax=Riccia fluitans TaxID=41844 RepID=A0ABD1Y2M2_9MARC
MLGSSRFTSGGAGIKVTKIEGRRSTTRCKESQESGSGIFCGGRFAMKATVRKALLCFLLQTLASRFLLNKVKSVGSGAVTNVQCISLVHETVTSRPSMGTADKVQ